MRAHNITDWRRSVAGDLTAAFDFTRPDFSIPDLPDTVPLIMQSDEEENFAPVATPPEGGQMFPVQEPGSRPHRPSIHQPLADAVVHRGSGRVTATLSVRGKVGVSLTVYPDDFLAPTATPFTVVEGSDKTYTWDTSKTAGKYAFSVYGPRRYAGRIAQSADLSALSEPEPTAVVLRRPQVRPCGRP